ncbi:hypothetical protein ACUXV3_12470 [Roseobacteraceae bacterium NS-SX3]
MTFAPADMPSWFPEFMRFYARPEKPTIKQALAEFSQTLDSSEDAPGYWQVRHAIRSFEALFSGDAA